MAKPMLVTIPFVMLLLDFWPLKRFQYQYDFNLKSEEACRNAIRRNYRIIIEKIPLFIPVVISCIVTFFAQKSEGAVKAIEALPMKYRIENAIVSYVNYVLKAIWPHKLAVFYPHPVDSLSEWHIIGATLLIVASILFAIKAFKEHPYVAVGLFWYLGTLVPVIGLLQVGDQAMADRYTYIPLIGIFIVIAWGGANILKRWPYRKIYLVIFALIILSALTERSFSQASHWKNSITLFEHTINVTENNYKAHNNLATALGPIDLDEAISHYREALRINPNYVTSLTNLGIALVDKGNYDEAVSCFTKVLEIDPQNTDARMNLANVFFEQEKSEKAISMYREILKTDPEDADTHYNIACVLSSEGKINKAVLHYKETIRINPRYSKAHYNLGNILLSQGKIAEAFYHFAMVIQFKPDFVQAYNKLGVILCRQGKFNKAGVFFSKALQIDPEFSEARANLDILRNRMSN
jgi:tetratricopeptide (TPR) repeat protein